MKNYIPIIALFFFLIACNTNKKDQAKSNEPFSEIQNTDTNSVSQKDSVEVLDGNAQNNQSQLIVLVNDSTLSNWYNTNKHHPIDKEKYKLDQFSRLKDGQTQFSYYLLKEISTNPKYNTAIVYEYYDSESAVWLVNYSKENDLIDALEVFYDNAEGAWLTTSKIDFELGVVDLTIEDVYASPTTKKEEVKIAPFGQFEKK